MISDFLRNEIKTSLAKLYPEAASRDFDVTPDGRFGDYSSNAALVVAGEIGQSPREVAETIIKELSGNGKFLALARAGIAGAGFINFSLTDEAIENELKSISEKVKSEFNFLAGRKINIEFISANPTGELHIGHGRGAFYGDALANIFKFSGAEVTREYFINDSRESNQIKELGKTAVGDGKYYKKEVDNITAFTPIDLSDKEEDIGFKIAQAIQGVNQTFVESGNRLGLNIKGFRWYSEDTELRASFLNDRVLVALKTKELTYEKDGAVWLKTSEYGDDEDRVVVRSDGSKSYFLSDIAYHSDKFARGYDEVIDVWGADHHGHVKRMQAVKKMLGWEGELRIFITQLVSLKEGKMSKREGIYVPLRKLVMEFGLDVVRWFYNEKSLNTHMEFDMALARERSAKNPVFYVQYAHARIASIIEKAKGAAPDKSEVEDILSEKTARALTVKIIHFEDLIESIAEDCQVHKLTTYAYELASAFAQFYENVRIIGEKNYNSGALSLATLAKDTLTKSLGLLGVSAPEKM